jgi:crotonobetainyl-CoA:carnitine CoA-transferase CaiB-like acyl-CoA transferase
LFKTVRSFFTRIVPSVNFKPEGVSIDFRFSAGEARVQNNEEVVNIVEKLLDGFDKVSDVAALLQTYRIQAVPAQTMAQIENEDPQFKTRYEGGESYERQPLQRFMAALSHNS